MLTSLPCHFVKNVKADLLSFVELYNFVKIYFCCFTPTTQFKTQIQKFTKRLLCARSCARCLYLLSCFHLTLKTSMWETFFPWRKRKLNDLTKVTNPIVKWRQLNSNWGFQKPSSGPFPQLLSPLYFLKYALKC